MMVAFSWVFRRTPPARVDKVFRRLQLVSAAAFSLMHGANDAQKTMGIIAGVLFTAGYQSEFTIPFWVVIAAHLAIGLGTLSGGWRIIHTMGSKITKLHAGRRLRRRDRRRGGDPHRHAARRRHQHDAHGDRRDRRRRRHAPAVRRALGRGPAASCGRGC